MAMSILQNPEKLTPQMPHGYRFHPDDQELVRFYLYKKITDPYLFTAINVPVRDCPLFGDQAREPWQIWDSFPKRHGEDLFFFTHLTKKGKNFVRKICRGPGTWHQESKHPPFNVSIDHTCQVTAIKKQFTYHNPKSDQNCSWFMFEYSLPSLSEQTVLCQLKRKEVHASEKVQTTTTATKRRKRYADGLDDATNTMFQKPRVEEDAQKQQIMGFNGAAKIVSQVENQQLHLELEPVFDNGVQSDNFESFYREPSAVLENYLMDADSGFTSTSNAAPPTVFTLDPAENLQPSDNDGDAAATEDDDFPPEIFGLLDLSGYCDEEDGVPATQETAEASAYWVQAIPTIDPSFTADAIDYYLERGVFDSSLANCSGSFLQMQLQAATSPIQENEIQMISNPFHMKRYR
ncbi:hypothetical protein D5086_013714 [Populus alba]|uniref:Uncharacterized protein n=3 Tax=Populus TaxID=3689 RepID=A0ACC4C7M4_POPAL|nr:protein ATAF2-like [Populus alba]TKR99729.1 hypothetical protein D5086_0000191590 [Populus alba]